MHYGEDPEIQGMEIDRLNQIAAKPTIKGPMASEQIPTPPSPVEGEDQIAMNAKQLEVLADTPISGPTTLRLALKRALAIIAGLEKERDEWRQSANHKGESCELWERAAEEADVPKWNGKAYDDELHWGRRVFAEIERLKKELAWKAKQTGKCEGCGLNGGAYTCVHTTNGCLVLCHQCLSDLNRKNPELPALRAEIERLKTELAGYVARLGGLPKETQNETVHLPGCIMPDLCSTHC